MRPRPAPVAGPGQARRPHASAEGGRGPAPRSRPATARRPDPPLRLTRRGKIVLIGAITGFALGALLLGTHAVVTASTGLVSPAQQGLPYVDVKRGDTLWTIATAVGNGGDPASTVRQIMNINGLSGSLIQPGTRLYLPSGMPG
ncbi:LysM peptidoglycan-binding domain-containing protein [Planotetraspora thailandica]|uniref:LysM peptidoglycan-binding domain-containing protein n=1 Tax=Planotetraspora thailandica TaxID=487172 RepID=UPI00195130AE|nr:LysM peptidoglycan-binding domain-containing protein [Planotetraspora thailandica]